MQKLPKQLLETFFPSFCLGCQQEGCYLCDDCKATLEISEHRYCLCSKNPFRLPHQALLGKCGRCSDRKLSGLFSALAYQEKALTRKLVHQFKYDPYLKDLAKVFAGLILEHLLVIGGNVEHIWENSMLIAVPLEKSKLKNRGYNQSEELAKELSAALMAPLSLNNLVKITKTEPQVSLSAKERSENLRDAFLVSNPKTIKGKKIFLVDDVYTTGSTMEEAARVLRENGAKSVWGITIAREG